MSQETLTGLALISIENEVAGSLHYDELKFASLRKRRRDLGVVRFFFNIRLKPLHVKLA